MQTFFLTESVYKNHLKLNSSKLEILRVSKQHKDPEMVNIAGCEVTTASAVKCLGIWWQYNLSVSHSVQEHISKARKAFFALGNILIHKLSFLAKLLFDRNDTVSGRILTSIAIVDVNNVGIFQQY